MGLREFAEDYDIELTSGVIKAIEAFQESIDGGFQMGVILGGDTGVGKTRLLKIVQLYMVLNEFVVFEWLDAYKADKCFNGLSGNTLYNIHKMPYLILDDIGAERDKIMVFGTVINPIEEIVMQRYEMAGPRCLFASTNLSMGELNGRYGSRVISRLAEHNRFIRIEGKDFRL